MPRIPQTTPFLREGTSGDAAVIAERSGKWCVINRALFDYREVEAPHRHGGIEYRFDLNSVEAWKDGKEPRVKTWQDVIDETRREVGIVVRKSKRARHQAQA